MVKDREDQHELLHDELEKIMLNFSRYAYREVTPLNEYIIVIIYRSLPTS